MGIGDLLIISAAFHLNGRSSTFPFDSSPVPIFSDYIEDKLATNYTVTHIINLGFLHEF